MRSGLTTIMVVLPIAIIPGVGGGAKHSLTYTNTVKSLSYDHLSDCLDVVLLVR